ncbi:MAG: hypothetical protein AAB618_00075 [Patescibacteria group bacterium]
MPNTPSSSFIPKQGPAKHSRQVVSRQVHLFTVLSYVLFFGALAASAGVFLYARHIDSQQREEVAALDTAIANFSDEKMEQVKAFNTRLMQAEDRITNSVSAISIFEALEESTVQAAALESLTLKRVADEKFLITALINTDTFDSTLFQRGLYERNPVIKTVSFEDVSLGTVAGEESEKPAGVSFKAELQVPLTAVPYVPEDQLIPQTGMTVISSSSSVPASEAVILPVNDSSL